MAIITLKPPVDIMALPPGKHAVAASLTRTKEPVGTIQNLRCIVRGNSRVWEFRYTMPGKPEQYLSLGAYSTANTVHHAILARDANAELVRQGIDPKAQRADDQRAAEDERRRIEGEPSYREFVLSLKGVLPKRPRSAAAMLRYGLHVLGDVADKKPHQITVADLQGVLESRWDQSGVVRETVKYVSRFLQIAQEDGLIPAQNWINPASLRSLKRKVEEPLKEQQPRKAVGLDEIDACMAALRAGPRKDQYRINPMSYLIVEMLALTCLRSREVSRMLWSWIDREAMLIRIPRAAMKNAMKGAHKSVTHFRVPLTPPMIRLLDRAAKLAPPANDDAPIFPTRKRGVKFFDDSAILKTLEYIGFRDPEADAGDRTTVHGFRSTFSDWAMAQTRVSLGADGKPLMLEDEEVTEQRWSALMVDMCIAHVPKDKVQRAYWRDLPPEPRRGIMLVWNAFLEPKVVDLAARRPAPAQAPDRAVG